MSICIAIDMGGSKALAGLVASDGSVLSRIHETISLDEPDKGNAFIARCERLSRALLQQTTEPVIGIGVNLPGVTDAVNGVLRYAPFSGIENLPVAAELSKRMQLPVWGENDVNACALAERRWGAASPSKHDCSDFMWMTVSSGIGGALVLEGKVRAGADGCCGEFGHMVVREDGFLCGCGQRGCLEIEAAGPAWTRHWQSLDGTMIDDQWPDARKIAELARQGDPLALQVVDIVGHNIGRGLAWVANAVNPGHIYLGGGVMGAADILLPVINETLRARAMVSRYRVPLVDVTGLGYEAGLLGAAALVPEGEAL